MFLAGVHFQKSLRFSDSLAQRVSEQFGSIHTLTLEQMNITLGVDINLYVDLFRKHPIRE